MPTVTTDVYQLPRIRFGGVLLASDPRPSNFVCRCRNAAREEMIRRNSEADEANVNTRAFIATGRNRAPEERRSCDDQRPKNEQSCHRPLPVCDGSDQQDESAQEEEKSHRFEPTAIAC